MINILAPLLLPLTLTTSPNPQAPPSYHQVRAYVTGYNTVAAQTDNTPCIAASGADICGRHDAVACPRRITLGTVVEINGTTYVCEDRLARKYDARFDISCDQDTTCPPEVTGWATINVYDREAPTASAMTALHPAAIARFSRARPSHAVAVLRPAATRAPLAYRVTVLRGTQAAKQPSRLVRQAHNTRSHAARIWHG